MDRFVEYIFFVYFVVHIPITLLVDSQALVPKTLYPTQLQKVMTWYLNDFKDAMMAQPPLWFKSFVFCELLLQFPFFFPAAYAFWKGIKNCKWIRIPLIVYSAHVATTTVAISFHILLHDFSGSKFPGPETMEERFKLLSVYLPFLVVPFLLLIDALLSSAYREQTRGEQTRGKRQKQN